MTTEELLSHLDQLNVALWAEGDRLRFKAPKGIVDAPLRAELTAHKEEILTILRLAAAPDLSPPAVVPVPRDQAQEGLPASSSQQRQWFLVQLEPDTPAYNLSDAARLRGRLDAGALEAGFNHIVRRHETLRTTFREVDGRPLQVISPRLNLPLPRVDLDALPAPARDEESRRLAAADAVRLFDLKTGPLIRTTLVRLAEQDHVLLVSMHHIVSDGWSVMIVIRELTAFYEAQVTGKPVRGLPELSVQYADFAHWQRQWLREEVLEALLVYWRRQLAGPPPVLELPCDRPRPASMRTSRGARQALELPAALSEGLRALSREQGSTLFMTLLAGLMTLLHRYTGQQDLAVGSPIANRNRTEIEGLIGFFVNTLVLRVDLSGAPTFQELLGRVRELALGAYAHQDLPFEKLVAELDPVRDRSRPPLAQVILGLNEASPEVVELAGLVLTHAETDRRSAMFDLSLILVHKPQCVSGYVEYATDVFDRTTIIRLTRHWRVLLEAIAAQPEKRIPTLPLMTAGERRQLVSEWNATRSDFPQEKSIRQLFELQAERTPEAVAVVFAAAHDREPHQRLSYRELNLRANRLAHHLRALGVGSEVVVGLFLERSAEALTAIFAVIKAGGAYLPLDPAYPRDRLAFMLDDAGAAVVLTRERLAPELPESRAAVVRLDADGPAIAARSPQNPGRAGRASNLVYVIYTSGSTGRPKGVMLTDRGLCGLVAGQIGFFGIGPHSRVLQFSSLSFDASVCEIFSTLVGGGTLCLGSAEELMPGPELNRFLRRQAVTNLTVVPSALQAMPDEELPALASLTVAGEACSPELVKRWAAGRRLVNAYGPTENTVCASAARIRERGDGERPPIGRPFAASRLYVVDRCFELVPIGVPGELLIAGTGLARGYLGRPELTAERFVPDPWSAAPPRRGGGERLYRSGDLVRFLPAGQLEFLGRIDQQVKLRGFRIELGEVEAAVAAHPAVREAVATVCGQRLVAYAVPSDEAAQVRADELRARVAETLPEYMVPSAVVFLDSLPLTPNGKVDRGALPAPDRLRPQGEVAFVPPQTPLEELVAGAWSEVLGVDRVGLRDSFFALGGHSLLAAKVFSRLNDALAAELPLSLLFNTSDLGELAARIGARLGEREGAGELLADARIRPRDPGVEPLPLSFSQERLWLLDRLEPGSTAYKLTFPIRLEGELEVAVLECCLNELARRHESLRTSFGSRDGLPVQVIHPLSRLRLPVVDLEGVAESDREARVMALIYADMATPFDLERGPLWRTRLLRLGRTRHVLVQNMHHIISDGWSIGLIFRELATLLEALSVGRTAPFGKLPELPIQYPDFAIWQRERIRGKRLESRLGYWRQQLAGAATLLELPSDRPRPAFQSHRGTGVERRLPADLSGALHALSRRHDATLFMTLLAGFKLLLYRFTGEEDLIVGAPIAGRDRIEIEQLIGFFVNTLALRTRLDGGLSFGELLGRVRETVIGATVNQEVPFEKLLDELQPERSLSHSPLFQVFFNMINLPDQRFTVPGLDMEGLPLPETESKFDFTLYVEEVAGTIELRLVYGVDLFDRARMVEMLAQYAGLLEQIVADPEAALGSYSLVSAGAEEFLPRPAEPLSGRFEGTVHGIFASQAAHFPDQVAVVDPGESWSYRELDRRANQLARHLLAHGVEPHAVVAVYAHRSGSLVWALLGILKAGAAFVILDPAYPAARLCECVRRARARGWLEIDGAGEPPAELRALVAELGCTKLRLPRRSVAAAAGFLADQPASDPAIPITADDLGYVAFTSGSTGEPKGILGRHGAMTHFLPWLAETFRLHRTDRQSLLSALSHDPLNRDIFIPLCYGATLCIPDPEEIGTPGYLADWVGRHQLTLLNLVPAMLQLLCQSSPGRPPAALDSLRYAFIVGDVLSRREVAALYELSPSVRCVNYYGSTETQRALSYFVVPRRAVAASAQAFEKAVLPVGKGIRDVELLVLNPAGGLAGVG
ncbi:MAG: amino acid adenylation domain-containing protein, partial [bacterium]|nr:amino acid adenylation domain-containing protein [bacterium]